ncbi:SAM-dependent methyltransferase [Tessaracoccus antarcticus]|uniref:SAM-dependent methyltransferase n=1 Tax=Tessaracoccus antarcticus TaxID=2479848 RepID=A0A3M0GIL1_9ACTN|nr:SAM-dependent methyltransferase [Tessaracoccus antarcticus]RMB61453.1 SAM-dependent methyltransferase [Tessaracoccus antarcticus]
MVVVGGSAAGLSGAKIAARSRRSVLVIDSGAPRNSAADGVHNYLYSEGASPSRLGEIGRAEANHYGVQVLPGTASSATIIDAPIDGASRFTITIELQDGGVRTVWARRLLLATGLVDELPDIDGLGERWGRDVLHCPFCHGWEVRDRAIGVIGSGPMALHAVQLFRALSSDVVFFQHTAPDPTDDQRELLAALGVRHVVGPVTRIETTDDELSGVRMADGQIVDREAVAISTFLSARTDLVADLGLEMTDLEMGGTVIGRYLAVDDLGLTSAPGVWAAGNVSAPMAQVINSAAAGATSGAAIHMDLIAEDNRLAVTELRARAGINQSHDFGDRVRSWMNVASGRFNNTARYWDHREASWVDSRNGGSDVTADDDRAGWGPSEQFWEPHYAASAPATAGPNAVLVETVEGLSAGDALDLGCGGGGDAVWLAQNGWNVTTVDVSSTALDRVALRAGAVGVGERVRTEHHDLARTFPAGSFDLVTAQYLLSPVEFDRPSVLAQAATAIRPGGMLLIVDHASVAPWSWADPETVFPSPRDTLEAIGLDLEQWDITRLENCDRSANGPDGQSAVVTDTVIALTRR